MVGLAVTAVLFEVGPVWAAAGAGTTGPVGIAIKVPGTATLNAGGVARVDSVSCPSARYCVAAGTYTDGVGDMQAFIANEANGVWHTAIEVPGTAALNSGGNASVTSVSCPTVGNCAIGGDYVGSSGLRAFVADEVNGVWHRAIQVPGLAALNAGQFAALFSVSCGSVGSCVAGGYYTADNMNHRQAFVVGEVNGVWHKAIEVPGSGALNTDQYASVTSVSCLSAADCVAGGSYRDGAGLQAFVANEVNGDWHKAIEVPGLAALNTGHFAAAFSVSCGSVRKCAAGGDYLDTHGDQAFVADEVNGVWHKAIEVPGTAALNSRGAAETNSVSCPSAGNCAAGGGYVDTHAGQPFVADEVNGVWHKAILVPGLAALNAGGDGQVWSVSCGSAGNCVAGGYYHNQASHQQVFVAAEMSGVWHNAIQVPGTAALNAGGDASLTSVSCPSDGDCVAGGSYKDSAGHLQAFVTSFPRD